MKKYVCFWICFAGLLVLSVLKRDDEGAIHFPTDNYYMVQHYGEQEEDVYSQNFLLEKGTYQFDMVYAATEEGNSVQILNHGIKQAQYDLLKNGETASFEIKVNEPTNELTMNVHYSGVGYLGLTEMTVTPLTGAWYQEKWLGIVGVLGIGIMFGLCDILKKRKKISDTNIADVLILLGLGIVFSNLVFGGYAITSGDDLNYHLTRIEGIASGLRHKELPVYIFSEYLSGNGYLNVMYPSLFLYIPALLRVSGVSLALSYKIFLVCINIATAFSMFYSMKSLKAGRETAFVAAVAYLAFRYRFVDMYSRAAVGETLALIFLPIVIAGIYHILEGNQNKWYILMWGMTGVLQSHVLSACMYVFILAVIAVFYIPELIKNKRITGVLKAAIGCLFLNLSFIVPFIHFYLKGNLYLEELNKYPFWKYCMNPSALIGFMNGNKGVTDTGHYSLRPAIVALLGIYIIGLIKKRVSTKNEEETNKEVQFAGILAIPILICIIMATDIFPYERFVNVPIVSRIFYTIQFPWRFVGPAGCLIIICGCMFIKEVTQNAGKQYAIMAVITALACCDAMSWHFGIDQNVYDYVSRNDAYNSALTSKISYNSVGFPREYFVNGQFEFTQDYGLSDEYIEVNDFMKERASITLQYANAYEGDYIDLPLQHYLGYVAFDENREPYEIMTNEKSCIRVYLKGDGEKHSLLCKWKKPKIYVAAEVISFISLIIVLIQKKIYVAFINKNRKKRG